MRCSVCNLWFHRKCTGLPSEVYNSFTYLIENGHPNVYKCTCCNSAWETLEKKITLNAAAIKEPKDGQAANSSKIDENTTKISTLSKDLENMKSTNIARLAADAAAKAALADIADIESRRHNLVIQRLAEAPASTKDGKERHKADLDQLKTVMEAIGCGDVMDELTHSFRAGKPSENQTHPRPFIITLANVSTRSKILTNAKKLADTDHKTISIQPDLTNKQRDYEKDFWKQAEEMTEAQTAEDQKNFIFKPRGLPGARKIRRLRINPADDNPQKRKRSPEAERTASKKTNKTKKKPAQ